MKSIRAIIATVLVFGVTIFLSCSRWFQPAVPKLVVVIVVDQMRYDYLVRFAGLFSGGFAKLLHEGAVFTKVHHDHAGTETAPGHATLLTGSYPSHHGIIGNNWYDRATDKSQYCVDDEASPLVTSLTETPSVGKSPRRLLRHTLGDWLKAKFPNAKVISISGKDRSAILMGGYEADAAYWFSHNTGGFVSSRYYFEALPEWAAQWNTERRANHYFGKPWEKSRPETDYFVAREDFFTAEGDGEHTTFPHAYVSDEEVLADSSLAKIDKRFYDWLAATPAVDALTLEFAQQALVSEKLGADATPDLLLVSLKATDLIGHAYGPLSQESEDNLLRLDTELGNFFAFLEAKVGLKNCVIALSADHGVLPLPEELRRRGFESARILAAEALDEMKSVEKELQQEWGFHQPIFKTYLGDVNLNNAAADSLRLSPAELRARVAVKLRSLSFVSDIFTSDELSATDGADRENLVLQRHSFQPDRGPDLTMQLKPYYLVRDNPQGTTHGSPYAYDSHVPLIFWGERFKPGRVETPHKTVDLAPTLAYLLNLDLSRPAALKFPKGDRETTPIAAGFDGEVLRLAIKE
ncbi:MAG: Alkaline phosphatase PafA [bacterium]|nr:Alkaline phosphatase PafA [bacterium]